MTSETQKLIDEYAAVAIALHGLRMKSLEANDVELADLNEAMSRLLACLLGILQKRFMDSLSDEARSYLAAKLPPQLGNIPERFEDSVLFQTEPTEEAT